MPKNPAQARTTRRKKDPNAPKRPITAYMFFAQEIRQDVRREYPDAKFGDIGKLIGEKWRGLEEKEKKKYEDLANNDKKRYDEEKEKYMKEKEEPRSE